MTPALLANVLPRVISVLGANPGAWSGVVSGSVGAFPDDDEILAATLEADGNLITKGYFQSVNDTLSQPFMQMGSPIARGEQVDFHYGHMGRVELSKATGEFVDANVNTGTDVITVSVTSPLVTGDPISFLSTGVLPTGLVANTTYNAIVITTDTIKVAASYQNALLGTAVNITSAAGGGTHTIIGWQTGQPTENVADITNAISVGETYVGANSFTHLYKIDGGDFYYVSKFGRIELPVYERTTVLQADKADEMLIAALAIKGLTKNASPAPFEKWTSMADEGMQAIIRDGSYQGVDENP